MQWPPIRCRDEQKAKMFAVPEEWLVLVEHIEDVHIVSVPSSYCANGEAKSMHHDRPGGAPTQGILEQRGMVF
jgi:hypothetical protein